MSRSPVRLSEVVESFLDNGIERTHYIDLVEGTVLFLSENEDSLDFLDLGDDDLETVRRGDVSIDEVAPERFVHVPGQDERYELEAMRAFAHSRPSDAAGRRLVDATYGRGLYRRFKDEARHQGLIEEWYAYRTAYVAPLARAWLVAHDIPFVDDLQG